MIQAVHMINHVYTLLRNITGYGVDPSQGGEYTPPEYRAVPLTQGLSLVRGILFGATPDPVYLNYRLRQYMTVLHAGDYVDHVANYDSRWTYWPFSEAAPFAFGISISQKLGINETASPDPPVVQGQAVPNDTAGRCEFQWPLTINRSALILTAGLSAPVQVPGSPLFVLVPGSIAAVTNWTITAIVPPAKGLAEIVKSLDTMGERAAIELFGVDTTEPQATYRNLWNDNDQLPERLTGVLLALAYRTEALRSYG